MSRKAPLLVAALVIYAATLSLTLLGVRKVLAGAPLYAPSSPMNVWHVLFILLLITAMVIFLLRLLHGRLVFQLFFSLAMFAGVWFLADIFLPAEEATIAATTILVARYLVPRVAIQNLLVVIGVSGVAVNLGFSLPWVTLMVLAVILAVYDIVAVYWTEHMITMMKGLLARGVIFAAVLPERPHGNAERLDRVHPHEGFMLVGTGDLALPASFVAAVASNNFSAGIFTALGALVGFLVTTIIFIGSDRSRPMPALPPIVLGMILGLGVSFFSPLR